MKRINGYSKELANQLLEDLTLYLVGPNPAPQKKYVDNKPTDEIAGYHVWCATEEDNPFKIKFLPEDEPDLSGFSIGDEVVFENLEAIQIDNRIYFRAQKIKKA
ncbi:hypothetical protein [Streptococcus merionis]|uniref:hypothetical protein n=1 Tax=Streptococcus merionis TaxID=400065 RepID=UPI0035162555